MNNPARRVVILHHFMYPDDVVSALHLDGLAQGLAAKGWQVEAFPCNRGCRDETKTYPRSDTYQGVRYRRIWRPGFSPLCPATCRLRLPACPGSKPLIPGP